MERILLYKISFDAAGEREERYSLLPWEDDAPGRHGGDDGGRHYLLPDGYTLVERGGRPEIYSGEGALCPVHTHNAAPLLIDNEKKLAILLEREKKIRDRREAAGLTRAELAEALGVPQALLFAWENCEKEPDMKTLRGIAAALGCEVFDLT